MPKRTDISSILVIGSGPIVIGQACEFDYSGAQACKALRREGFRVILVNSNPATIMTDPQLADATYIEPLLPEVIERIMELERPDAVLPTVGGQTALNLAMELERRGAFARHGALLLGAKPLAIELAEDRERFKQAMEEVGLPVLKGETVTTVEQALEVADGLGYPVLIRPSYTLGGSGGGIAVDREDLRDRAERGLRASPVTQVLIEESILGWKEFELEVMRDGVDNFVVVCTIENLDAMGVHTGDSITIAPAMTLTDREQQRLRDMAKLVLRTVGVETGGSNVQFAVDPKTGRAVVIEMNPRVSRSSALASKATGFPIAKIAALVAVGYTLDEVANDITRETPASFEPSLDYVVVKIPRWAFEKFPGSSTRLGPQMKSVGEVMAIGATLPEALQKALRGLELGLDGLESFTGADPREVAALKARLVGSDALAEPTPRRLFLAGDALRAGASVLEVAAQTGFDPWFVEQLALITRAEAEVLQLLKDKPNGSGSAEAALERIEGARMLALKQLGFSDARLARLVSSASGSQTSAVDVRRRRAALGVTPVYRRVDTCAAEFAAHTPYMYATYSDVAGADESEVTTRPKVMVLGGGPNRIGQGIEFDYCCVHACYALRELGYEAIMVNCNPETVSTDYDTADRLYFEPLTCEDVLNIWELESKGAGPVPVLVQFGGQTPLNIAGELVAAGVPIWGTSPDAIDLAEDRGRFGALLRELGVSQPPSGMARTLESALEIATRVGYPVLVRPSFVLGGRAMAIAYDGEDLARHFAEAEAAVLAAGGRPGQPVLIDRYLEDALELDIDAIGDGERVVVVGQMEHVEEAGVHSGDSAMVLPPYKLGPYYLDIIRRDIERIGLALGIRGLMNVQCAIQGDRVYVLEVNPRASRTVPFVAKATGVPLAKRAAAIATGKTLEELGLTSTPPVQGYFVKEAVLPFDKFSEAPVALGPEMRSTGEVMGHAPSFGMAFAKAVLGAKQFMPEIKAALLTVNDHDKGAIVRVARELAALGFSLYATGGTAAALEQAGVPIAIVYKAAEGRSPSTAELVSSGEVSLVINTPLGSRAYTDGQALRAAALRHGVMLVTTLTGATAMVEGLRELRSGQGREPDLKVRSLQSYHAATPAS